MKKALIVGLGSIGLRHSRLLKLIDKELVIIALRHNPPKKNHNESIDHVVSNIDDALSFEPDFAIIANPASHHIEIAIQLAKKGIHLLIEKPISSSLDGVKELLDIANKNNSKIMVGYNLRFLGSLSYLKKKIDESAIGKVLSIRAEVGQNLETWRDNQDYREGVSAQKKLGGGVLLELSHEIDYLKWIFGKIDWTIGYVAHQSNLEIDVEDIAHCFLGFSDTNSKNNFVANLSLDFFRHDPIRQCLVVGERGTLKWDGINNMVEIFVKGSDKWELIFSENVDKDFSYMQELNHFLDCIDNNNETLISGLSAMNTLKIINSVKQSSDSKNLVQVEY